MDCDRFCVNRTGCKQTLAKATKMTEPISTSNAEHYLWGVNCDGWHLLKRDDLSIIQEYVPRGSKETMHYHEKSRQFFYILEGEGQLTIEDDVVKLIKGQGLEIAPQVKHRFENNSNADVVFLVISVPKSHGDRINIE
jgi:mannose-6-phosphate isomerase-like protein (cupin superfamily)